MRQHAGNFPLTRRADSPIILARVVRRTLASRYRLRRAKLRRMTITLCGRLAVPVVCLSYMMLLLGCASPYRADQGALFGGLTGAGLGALVGSASGNTGAGAAIGAGVGALSGAAVGGSLDEIEAQNRA